MKEDPVNKAHNLKIRVYFHIYGATSDITF